MTGAGARVAWRAVVVSVSGALLIGCGGSGRQTTFAGHARPGYEPVAYVPGGLSTVAALRIPGAGRLKIRAKRYRFQGHVYFNLSDVLEATDGAGGGSDWRPEGHAPLAWTFDGRCAGARPDATVIFFGLLRAPADTATVYAGRVAHRVRTAPVPARFQAGGVAAYAVLGAPPERVLVRTPGGKVAMDEGLGHEGPLDCKGSSGGVIFLTKKRPGE